MKHFIHILILAQVILLAGILQAQDADVRLDRNEIRIGEQAVLSLSYRVQKTNMPTVTFPTIGAELTEGIEVLKKTKIDTLKTGGNVSETRLEQKVYITAFDSGSYKIPGFSFQANGNEQKTAPITFTVQTVEIDTTGGIFGNRDGYEVDVNWKDYVTVFFQNKIVQYGGIGLIAALLILLGVYYLRKNRKPQEAPVQIIPETPPYEVAVNALQALLDEKKYMDKNVKKLHTCITDILRTYLEDVFQIHAHEETSSQIMKDVRYLGIEEKSMQSLRKILFRGDMVKFAKEHPDQIENELAIKDALAFVMANRPAERTEPEKDEEVENV